jgi:hypothetical protein
MNRIERAPGRGVAVVLATLVLLAMAAYGAETP